MQKYFNTTGLCVPEVHYMVDISKKIKQIEKMIDRGFYFTINRGRQYGKTTTINMLDNLLSAKYTSISISFEGIGDEAFADQKIFNTTFINRIIQELKLKNISKQNISILEDNIENTKTLDELSDLITLYCKNSDRKVILIINEVDQSSNNKLFLNFLGMLRNKYLERFKKPDSTFYSVILVGVYDIKNLKLKITGTSERKYNSPWNIAKQFNVDMFFNPSEIATMLQDYEDNNHTNMDIKKISEEIYKYTSGYPFLVSRICQIIDEELNKDFTINGIQKANKIILSESSLLFDDLFKNIENYPELYKLLADLLVGENDFPSFDTPEIQLGLMFGILKIVDNKLQVSNLLYEIRIYNYLILKIRNSKQEINKKYLSNNFIENNTLNMEKVLIKFSEFMQEEHRNADEKFIEQNGRLLFLSFLKPIINDTGFYFVEPQTRNNRRMDIVVTYNNQIYIIELKLWYGKKYGSDSISQLIDYLNIKNSDTCYLLTFNFNKNKEYTSSWLDVENKKIFSVMI